MNSFKTSLEIRYQFEQNRKEIIENISKEVKELIKIHKKMKELKDEETKILIRLDDKIITCENKIKKYYYEINASNITNKINEKKIEIIKVEYEINQKIERIERIKRM